MIKWIVTDMDGTLLNSENKISEGNREVLIKAQKAGMKLILASGRSQYRLFPYAEQLQMKEHDGYLIEVNGMGYRRLRNGKRVLFGRLQKAQSTKIFNELKRFGGEVQGYLDNALYMTFTPEIFELKKQERQARGLPEDYPWTGGPWSWLNDSRDGYPYVNMVYCADQLPYELNKLIYINDEEKVSEVYEEITKTLADFEITRTSPRLIEIGLKGITKGHCLEQLMKDEGIDPAEVIAFGDGENDADMFSKVKYSIAMGNAAPYVKEQAFDVTLSNLEDGVAVALKKYCKELCDSQSVD